MIRTLAELAAIKEKARPRVEMRGLAETETKVLVGSESGNRPVLNAFVQAVAKQGLPGVIVIPSGRDGGEDAPVVEIVSAGKETVSFGKVTPEMAEQIVLEHLANGRTVSDDAAGSAGEQ